MFLYFFFSEISDYFWRDSHIFFGADLRIFLVHFLDFFLWFSTFFRLLCLQCPARRVPYVARRGARLYGGLVVRNLVGRHARRGTDATEDNEDNERPPERLTQPHERPNARYAQTECLSKDPWI